MQRKAIAVFGGSFNPPIYSHISLANQVINKLDNIEKLIFVPVSTKYQKLDLASDEHRYNMLQLICEDDNKLEVSDIELKQNKQLYTIQTLDLLKKEYGKEFDLYFIMGTDNLKQLDTWHEPQRLLKEYKIIVLERENDNLEEIIKNNKLLRDNKDSLIKVKSLEKINLSSSFIRKKLENREDVKKYIPINVLEYIKNNKLYL